MFPLTWLVAVNATRFGPEAGLRTRGVFLVLRLRGRHSGLLSAARARRLFSARSRR